MYNKSVSATQSQCLCSVPQALKSWGAHGDGTAMSNEVAKQYYDLLASAGGKSAGGLSCGELHGKVVMPYLERSHDRFGLNQGLMMEGIDSIVNLMGDMPEIEKDLKENPQRYERQIDAEGNAVVLDRKPALDYSILYGPISENL